MALQLVLSLAIRCAPLENSVWLLPHRAVHASLDSLLLQTAAARARLVDQGSMLMCKAKLVATRALWGEAQIRVLAWPIVRPAQLAWPHQQQDALAARLAQQVGTLLWRAKVAAATALLVITHTKELASV